MERFVRGDESRNTEGSGLGISIAKSLMELMGGSFMLYVDGDLFKVVLGFAQMEEEKRVPARGGQPSPFYRLIRKPLSHFRCSS